MLVGRLTKDIDLRYTANGTAVGSLTLAVNRNFTNQSGNREADFVNCVVWRKSAETLANYAHKGSLIGVTGRIQTRNYENQQGQRVYVTEVVVDEFQLLESKETNERRTSHDSSYNGAGGAAGIYEDNYSKQEQNAANEKPATYDNPLTGTKYGGDGFPF